MDHHDAEALARLRAELAQRWHSQPLEAMASAAARAGMEQGGEWGPPAGVPRHPDLLALNIGIPDARSLPRAQLSAALQEVLARGDDLGLRYDMGQGHRGLRELIAAGYARRGGGSNAPECFQLCTGASGAIDLVVRTLIEPGDVILAEAPAYLGTLRNFRGALAEVRSVPMDAQGLRVDALAEALRACKREGRRVKLVYTISTFQNPTGRTLSLPRRRALLELTAGEGVLVLDDDTYGELYYPDEQLGGQRNRHALPTLSSLADGHGVITVGSFSKVLATGLRVGFVHARPELIALLQRMRFEMGHSPFLLEAIARLGEQGVLDAHLSQVRALYQQKMTTLADALERHAAPYLRFDRPEGGFYLWAELAPGLDATQVWRAAYREGVAVNPGQGFFADGRDPDGEHLRIAFSWTPLERLDDAARRLARACERVAAGDPA